MPIENGLSYQKPLKDLKIGQVHKSFIQISTNSVASVSAWELEKVGRKPYWWEVIKGFPSALLVLNRKKENPLWITFQDHWKNRKDSNGPTIRYDRYISFLMKWDNFSYFKYIRKCTGGERQICEKCKCNRDKLWYLFNNVIS